MGDLARRIWTGLGLLAVGGALSAAAAYAIKLARADRPKLCAATPAVLASMRGPVLVDLYVTRGRPDVDRFVDGAERLLHELERQSGGRLHARVIEAEEDDARTKARALGLTEKSLPLEDDDARTGFVGVAIEYAGERGALAAVPPDTPPARLEVWIDAKLRELRDRAEHREVRVGVLVAQGQATMHDPNLAPPGTPSASSSLQTIVGQELPYVSLIDLHARREPVDATLDGLLVTQPGVDLMQDELAAIDDFVLSGKPVAFFVGAADVRAGDATMKATLGGAHGLERLLAGYGVELRADLVVEQGNAAWVITPSLGGPTRTKLPFVPAPREQDRTLDTSFPVFFRVAEAPMPFASSLVLHRAAQPDAAMRELARSTPAAVRLGDTPIDPSPLSPWTPAGTAGSVALAAVVQGTLRGAFDPSRRSAGRGRVLVVASSEMLLNPFVRAGAYSEPYRSAAASYVEHDLAPTVAVFENTLGWMSGDDALADCAQ
jgi:hypothetical protein